MTFRDGILEAFKPRFDSISKDCDRYSDALVACVDSGDIDRQDYFALSGKGSLWVAFQYIDGGFLDAVEAYIIRGETSRDIFGPLHENTRLTLDRLIEIGAIERVQTVYRAAIEHRIRALRSELAVQEKARRKQKAVRSKWIEHYLPSLRSTIEAYGALLREHHLTDPNYDDYLTAVETPAQR